MWKFSFMNALYKNYFPMVDCITYTPENLENLEFKYFEILSQLESCWWIKWLPVTKIEESFKLAEW